MGIVNVKRLWAENKKFWADKGSKLEQEIVFASMGTKKKTDPADKYVAALAGGDMQTNPPATNDAVEKSSTAYTSQLEQLPPKRVLDEIDAKIDPTKLEEALMTEGLAKFAEP